MVAKGESADQAAKGVPVEEETKQSMNEEDQRCASRDPCSASKPPAPSEA